MQIDERMTKGESEPTDLWRQGNEVKKLVGIKIQDKT